MKRSKSFITTIYEKLTDKGHKIPLIIVNLDIHKYRQEPKGSCMCSIHPDFATDKKLQQMTFDMCDYIRDNYDMENLLR